MPMNVTERRWTLGVTGSRRRQRNGRAHVRPRPDHPSQDCPRSHLLSRSTLYRKIAEGTFPSQLKISIHGAGWHESGVNRWIADPVAYREDRAE